MVRAMVAHSAVRERITAVCYVGKSVDDVTGRVENAFNKVLLSENADRKFRKAIKKGVFPELETLEENLEAAIETGILNSEEARLISEARAARWDAIQVDDYPAESVVDPVKAAGVKKAVKKTPKKVVRKPKVVKKKAAEAA